MTEEELQNMAAVAEATRLLAEEKKTEIQNNLPSWAEIDAKLTEIENLIPAMASMADAKVVLGKMIAVLRKDVRVTYLVAKNKLD